MKVLRGQLFDDVVSPKRLATASISFVAGHLNKLAYVTVRDPWTPHLSQLDFRWTPLDVF